MTPRQLKSWRDRMGYTQAQAAESLGVSLRTYTRWEVDKWPIPRMVELATEALTARKESQ